MFLSLFIKGIIIGFSIAMPVGPIGLLCIRNTLTLGFLGGLVSGFGAAVADGLFATIAGLGVSTIITFLKEYNLWVHSIGAIVLIGIGINIIKNASKVLENIPLDSPQAVKSLLWAFLSTMILTFVNPLTILSYAAVYATLTPNPEEVSTALSSVTIAGGVLIGAALWWFILSAITNWIKHKLDAKYMTRINTLSGIFLILLGVGTWIVALI